MACAATTAGVLSMVRTMRRRKSTLRSLASLSEGSNVQRLRALMRRAEIDAYVVPSADAHQSEYVAACDQRRAWLSGFTGSAGTAVVTEESALLWTDGRYFTQAENELGSEWTLMKDRLKGTPSVEAYLRDALREGDAVGFDPTTFSVTQANRLRDTLKKGGVCVKPIAENLVDLLWAERRPDAPVGRVRPHPVRLSGQSAEEKLAELRETLRSKSSSCAVVTALDEIAWLLNVRGKDDVPMNPVVCSYVVVTPEACFLFANENKIKSEETKAHLRDIGVTVRPYDLDAILDVVSAAAARSGDAGVLIDPSSCNLALADAIKSNLGLRTIEETSTLSLAKARKNKTELNGMRDAHVRDGAAVVRFLSWLETELKKGTVLSECDAADKVEAFRKEMSPKSFVGLSFDTIAGSGSNGAIIHYKPEPNQCATVKRDDMFLCDSGAQYLDGTTDITRTVHFGTPTSHEIRCFTRVLQGHIDLATVVFPRGTSGYQLDLLARSWLWRDGLDYAHGTGHGVGHSLNVHEGPHGISGYVRSDGVKLEPGFTVTNEPGYYEDGKFGIRHENVLVVRKVDDGDDTQSSSRYLKMETITFCPFQSKCIDASLLTAPQLEWLNAYHKTCLKTLRPLLMEVNDEEALAYLVRETMPIVADGGK